MTTFRWTGGSLGTSEGRYEVAGDWFDLVSGVQGDRAPATGDTVSITSVASSGIYQLGALFVFPVDQPYTSVYFFAPQDPQNLVGNPNALVGYTVQNQTMQLAGIAAPMRLVLQNSHILASTIAVTGTVVVASYLDNSITGSIAVGTATAPAFLQAEVIPFDVDNIGPTDHNPVTIFGAAITIAAGSTFEIEAGTESVTGVINNGTIEVSAGGTFVLDDTDSKNAATYQGGVDFAFNHTMLLGNGGTIALDGAAGQATSAIFLADVTGPGVISVNGHGAATGATMLTVDGYLQNEAVTLIDGTIMVNDATTAVSEPGPGTGFDVSGGSFTFGDANGRLVLHQAELTTLEISSGGDSAMQQPDGRTPFTTPISGFQPGDVIALPGKNLSSFGLGYTYVTAYDPGTGLLQVERPTIYPANPEVLAAFTFVGSYQANMFHLSELPQLELDLTYGPACFCAGTRLLTRRGEVAVEDLAIGDWMVTASGQHRPVRWIGRRSYGRRLLAANPGIQPVRFGAGSLGGGLPRRDLLVSPDHAMALDGLLIPARCLVNGESIVRERGMERVDYLHVELDSHDVLLAEGAPSESFLDDDSRFVFHNAREFAALYPNDVPVAGFCAPRVECGLALEAIRGRLAGVVRLAA